MIHLQKQPPPRVLIEHAEEWRDEYVRARASGTVTATVRFRYRHPDIKATLLRETSEKCAYCESKIPHSFPGEIEHIVPSSVRPEFIVEWWNLTLVCSECNRRKGAYHDDEEPLLNPYVDEPGAHLQFYGPLCLNVPGSLKGIRTVHLLELSRTALPERRSERLLAVQALIDRWEMVEPGATKDILKAAILREADPPNEYSAAVKAFLRHCVGW